MPAEVRALKRKVKDLMSGARDAGGRRRFEVANSGEAIRSLKEGFAPGDRTLSLSASAPRPSRNDPRLDAATLWTTTTIDLEDLRRRDPRHDAAREVRSVPQLARDALAHMRRAAALSRDNRARPRESGGELPPILVRPHIVPTPLESDAGRSKRSATARGRRRTRGRPPRAQIGSAYALAERDGKSAMTNFEAGAMRHACETVLRGGGRPRRRRSRRPPRIRQRDVESVPSIAEVQRNACELNATFAPLGRPRDAPGRRQESGVAGMKSSAKCRGAAQTFGSSRGRNARTVSRAGGRTSLFPEKACDSITSRSPGLEIQVSGRSSDVAGRRAVASRPGALAAQIRGPGREGDLCEGERR